MACSKFIRPFATTRPDKHGRVFLVPCKNHHVRKICLSIMNSRRRKNCSKRVIFFIRQLFLRQPLWFLFLLLFGSSSTAEVEDLQQHQAYYTKASQIKNKQRREGGVAKSIRIFQGVELYHQKRQSIVKMNRRDMISAYITI